MDTPLPAPAIKGRGAHNNPANRFEKLHYEPGEPDEFAEFEEEAPKPVTQFLRDHSRTILSHNDSPDIGFDTSLNSYRGCEHGCIYCYARPTHEYLGFRPGLDFETKIMVKEESPQLLRRELSSPRFKPRVIVMSGVTDCYQPIERKIQLTRRCLEVFLDFRNPVGIVTKNYLVTRDMDLLKQLAEYKAVCVCISVTSLNPDLTQVMEPRTARPARRLAAIEALAKAGVPVGALVCPVIPGLTDQEMPEIIKAVTDAGAQFAGYNMLRLPHAVKDLFEDWLDTHFPEKKNKVLNKIREVRGGKLYDADFATRMRGKGVYADHLQSLFHLACQRAGIPGTRPQLSTASFRRPVEGQLDLFG